jgi:hypothetical protein
MCAAVIRGADHGAGSSRRVSIPAIRDELDRAHAQRTASVVLRDVGRPEIPE